MNNFTDLSELKNLDDWLIENEDKNIEELKFEQYCGLFNLKPSHFGVPFKCNGKEYKLIGLNPKAPKYSVIGIDSEGKIYKFQDTVLEQII